MTKEFLTRPSYENKLMLKTAKQIGFTIPPRVLERANQVIK
jgi:hypothetical protein